MPWSKEQRASYMKRVYRKRRRIAHRLLASAFGHDEPQCVDCGATEGLQVDHLDPDDKSFNPLGSGYCKPWSDWIDEVLKCALRCESCHLVRSVREGHFVPPTRGAREAAAQLRARRC